MRLEVVAESVVDGSLEVEEAVVVSRAVRVGVVDAAVEDESADAGAGLGEPLHRVPDAGDVEVELSGGEVAEVATATKGRDRSE